MALRCAIIEGAHQAIMHVITQCDCHPLTSANGINAMHVSSRGNLWEEVGTAAHNRSAEGAEQS